MLALSPGSLHVYAWQPCICMHNIFRLPERVDRNNTDMPIRSNLSYATTPSDSTTKISGTCPSQAVSVRDTVANQLEGQACPEYSSFGPDYETIDSRTPRQLQRKDQAHARLLPERYEFSEAHLATGDGVPEVCANYEVPLNLRQNPYPGTEGEDYSHLKH